MTLVATLTITHSDDPNIKIGEQYGLILSPDQLVKIDDIPAGATSGSEHASEADAPEQPAQ